jgi:hypothetical protein
MHPKVLQHCYNPIHCLAIPRFFLCYKKPVDTEAITVVLKISLLSTPKAVRKVSSKPEVTVNARLLKASLSMARFYETNAKMNEDLDANSKRILLK